MLWQAYIHMLTILLHDLSNSLRFKSDDIKLDGKDSEVLKKSDQDFKVPIFKQSLIAWLFKVNITYK